MDICRIGFLAALCSFMRVVEVMRVEQQLGDMLDEMEMEEDGTVRLSNSSELSNHSLSMGNTQQSDPMFRKKPKQTEHGRRGSTFSEVNPMNNRTQQQRKAISPAGAARQREQALANDTLVAERNCRKDTTKVTSLILSANTEFVQLHKQHLYAMLVEALGMEPYTPNIDLGDKRRQFTEAWDEVNLQLVQRCVDIVVIGCQECHRADFRKSPIGKLATRLRSYKTADEMSHQRLTVTKSPLLGNPLTMLYIGAMVREGIDKPTFLKGSARSRNSNKGAELLYVTFRPKTSPLKIAYASTHLDASDPEYRKADIEAIQGDVKNVGFGDNVFIFGDLNYRLGAPPTRVSDQYFNMSEVPNLDCQFCIEQPIMCAEYTNADGKALDMDDLEKRQNDRQAVNFNTSVNCVWCYEEKSVSNGRCLRPERDKNGKLLKTWSCPEDVPALASKIEKQGIDEGCSVVPHWNYYLTPDNQRAVQAWKMNINDVKPMKHLDRMIDLEKKLRKKRQERRNMQARKERVVVGENGEVPQNDQLRQQFRKVRKEEAAIVAKIKALEPISGDKNTMYDSWAENGVFLYDQLKYFDTLQHSIGIWIDPGYTVPDFVRNGVRLNVLPTYKKWKEGETNVNKYIDLVRLLERDSRRFSRTSDRARQKYVALLVAGTRDAYALVDKPKNCEPVFAGVEEGHGKCIDFGWLDRLIYKAPVDVNGSKTQLQLYTTLKMTEDTPAGDHVPLAILATTSA
jgi:hypothetical protein